MIVDIWFRWCTNFLGLIVLLGFFSGCGNGGSSAPPPPPIPVQGIYYGQYTVTGAASPVDVYGAIDSGGFAYFADEYGTLYVLPTITDTGTLGGTMTAYASAGQTFSNGQSVTTFQVNASISSDGVFVSGEFSQTGETGTFQLNYEPLTISNVTASAGVYQGFYWGNGGNTAITLTLSPNNTFSGTDGFGCQISGAITPIPGYNLFTVTADSTGQAVCAGNVSGLGFAGTDDLTGQFGGVPGVYFYVGAANAKAGFTAEFKAQ
ncbi:MAG: hypothetical protein KGL00_09780 [Gammaproteobacteria bacterium]|nr:hypothetical protein [Gammaproteobacteria bacterium]MDE2274473.1 hypothetical protein [Gammaproteobacteria bacterium]